MKLIPKHLAWLVVVPVVAMAACNTDRDLMIGRDCEGGFCGETPNFTSQDGGDAETSLPETRMCPVTTCSWPWATCPSAEFPCGTDLLSDDNNCGGCGIRCGGEDTYTNSKWSCVHGVCAFSCNYPGWRDCDNDTGNGCETYVDYSLEHCGKCGNACAPGTDCDRGECIDECVLYGLPDRCNGTCTDLKTDDNNCGTCGTVCNPNPPGKPALHSSMRYGCVEGKCEIPTCKNGTERDCNGDLADGCEVTIHTPDNCSTCGDKCAPNKICGYLGIYRCLCDEGFTWCNGACRQLDDDPTHCGGCNNVCPGSMTPHFVTSCSRGVCGGECLDGYADCDGLKGNGCEVHTRVDNRNCGACGHACAPGQVCAEGTCRVAPCEPGEPGTQ